MVAYVILFCWTNVQRVIFMDLDIKTIDKAIVDVVAHLVLGEANMAMLYNYYEI